LDTLQLLLEGLILLLWQVVVQLASFLRCAAGELEVHLGADGVVIIDCPLARFGCSGAFIVEAQ